MSPSLLAVVWAGRRGPGAKTRGVQPDLSLAGRSLLRWGLAKAAALRPRQIFAAGPSAEAEKAAQAPARGAGFPAPDKDAAGLEKLLSGAGRRRTATRADVLFLGTPLAFVRTSTLRALIHRHRAEGRAATVLLSAGPAASARHGASRRLTPSWDALVIRFEDLRRVFSSSNPGLNPEERLARALEILASDGTKTGIATLPEADESLALRSPADASHVRAHLRRQKCLRLERRGVRLLDPAATWIDWDVRIGPGTIVYPAVVAEGRTVVGRDCRLYPFVHLIDTRLGSGVRVLTSTVLEGATLGRGARVGPFTHFRPGTVVKAGAGVGNFVEMKNTVFGRRSLASHLSYLGDATVGDDVNIGAGTITCNFDRVKKNPTAIGRGAFVGSGTELVGPVRVGRHAVIGAGSTITKDVSPWALAVARGRQVEIKDWAKRKPRK